MRFLKKKKNVSKTCNCNSDVKKDKDVKEGSNPEEGEKDSADQTNENAEIPVNLLCQINENKEIEAMKEQINDLLRSVHEKSTNLNNEIAQEQKERFRNWLQSESKPELKGLPKWMRARIKAMINEKDAGNSSTLEAIYEDLRKRSEVKSLKQIEEEEDIFGRYTILNYLKAYYIVCGNGIPINMAIPTDHSSTVEQLRRQKQITVIVKSAILKFFGSSGVKTCWNQPKSFSLG